MKILRVGRTMFSITAALLLFSTVARGQGTEANAATVAADLLIARPVGLAVTAVGAGLFVVSLPFVMITEIFSRGNIETAAKTLVATPARLTFERPLGATE